LLGVLIYEEAFNATQALGFGIVWVGLLIFCLEGFVSRRVIPAKAVPELGEG
jgi:EamA domain-containing membrane protein RarD